MYPSEIIPLLARGTATSQEIEQFNDWLDGQQEDVLLDVVQQLEMAIAGEERFEPYREEWLQRLTEKLPDSEPKGRRVHLYPWRWVAAAVVVSLLGTALFHWTHSSHGQRVIASGPVLTDPAPARPGAVLTLDDGHTVKLDSLPDSLIATQQGTRVALRNGALVYSVSGHSTVGHSVSSLSFNTVSTPRGRQFHLLLPDNTRVWLNAASSIRYPTAFTGAERKLEIKGEVYFEVAKNKAVPFVVSAGAMTIDVLGTRFNIKTYADEQMQETTLLDGIVRVRTADHRQLLKPGQQTSISGTGHWSVENADTSQVMAWKNGVFSFQRTSLDLVMRQLSRWYDIDVVYEGAVPVKRFDGEMGRDVNLSKVLAFLQGSGVHFRVEENGKKIIITQ
ncbi:MAG TPA: FecR domain-containing protein [Puia sp.]|jgi:ferric-dicitrate binding protein FerR (iron transport regulator)